MNLQDMNNQELHDKFSKTAVKTERKIMHIVVEFIMEMDRRRSFLDFAYPSLYEFLTKAHGYSSGAAQRRIDSARLLQEVPPLAEEN